MKLTRLLSHYSLITVGFVSFVSCSITQSNSRSPAQEKNDFKLVKSEHNLDGWSLREKIGQLMIVGYRDDAQVLDIQPGGVALFSWSLKNVEQTRNLTHHLKKLSEEKLRSPLLVAIDHEGGRVMRLRDGMTPFPEASLLGLTGNVNLARKVGQAAARELSYLGIHANFAPVLDIGSSSSFLGNRIWGSDPKVVAEMTSSYIQGLQEEGVMSVAKHFPGHGTSPEDAHFSTPTNLKSFRELWSEDIKPFQQAVYQKVPAMMTAHVRVPVVDQLPASMSSRFLSRILRESVGFDGVIITDDLEMKGVQEEKFSSGDLALQALIAGSDMLLIVWSKRDQKNIVERIEKAIKSGEWSEAELDKKVNRILTMKSSWIQNKAWKKNNESNVPPMKTKQHSRVLSELINQPIHWINQTSRDQMKSRFEPEDEMSWVVALPSGGYSKLWKKWRPQDEVIVYEKRAMDADLGLIRQKFTNNTCEQKKCLFFSEPFSGDAYLELEEFLKSSVSCRQPGETGHADILKPRSFLWVHMGLMPNLNEPLCDGSGVAALGASGTSRFYRFFNTL